MLQRRLWRLAGDALAAQPTASAPRLYVESLNEMIDMQTTRVSALNNRVPSAILVVEVIGAAIALALMALYLAVLSRGVVTVLLAAGLLTLLLFVTFDLDRPARGFIGSRGTARRAPRVDGAPSAPPAPLGGFGGTSLDDTAYRRRNPPWEPRPDRRTLVRRQDRVLS